ncbi:conserved hypothetical protein; putative membrane protein [Herminiimonas arsenicoxydans]|uniref:Uncharacterized protein n=1 Tax=Herminiimonas arsenicoxydans TaxID=204773 RepID=A4G5A6_HERAR|nr:conserved hypothetical protein; putative membrane protein [Herminiimonas arsenicoxydans]
MPLLGVLFVNLVGSFATWLVQFFTQKVAVATAISLLLGALILGLFIATRAALSGLGSMAGSVHPMFGAGISMIISPRVAALLTTYMAFWVTVELYKWKVNLLQLWARTI